MALFSVIIKREIQIRKKGFVGIFQGLGA